MNNNYSLMTKTLQLLKEDIGASPTEAWSTFCSHYNVNPRAFKNSYIYELKEIKDVIWYLKPENNVVYA